MSSTDFSLVYIEKPILKTRPFAVLVWLLSFNCQVNFVGCSHQVVSFSISSNWPSDNTDPVVLWHFQNIRLNFLLVIFSYGLMWWFLFHSWCYCRILRNCALAASLEHIGLSCLISGRSAVSLEEHLWRLIFSYPMFYSCYRLVSSSRGQTGFCLGYFDLICGQISCLRCISRDRIPRPGLSQYSQNQRVSASLCFWRRSSCSWPDP